MRGAGRFRQMLGYYDQAHFIKEFKTFTGTTPSEFIARRNQIAEMLTAVESQ